jgi:hypothetical protein
MATGRFRTIKRLGRAFGVGLGYAALGGLLGSAPLLILMAISPLRCEPGDQLCGGEGWTWFGVITFAFLGAALGFILGFAFSLSNLRPFSKMVSAVVRVLRRIGGWPAVAIFSAVLVVGMSVVWLRATSDPSPEGDLVDLFLDVRFDPELGAGIRMAEISLNGEGCVRDLYTALTNSEVGYGAISYPLVPLDEQDYGVCFGGEWPSSRRVLVLLFREQDHAGLPLTESVSVTIRSRAWAPGLELSMETLPDDLSDPTAIHFALETGPFESSQVRAWRVTARGVGDGLVVPMFQQEDVPAGIDLRVFSLLELETNPSTGPFRRLGPSHGEASGFVDWGAACQSPTCDFGWALWSSGPVEQGASISWSGQLLAFNTESEVVVDIEPCILVGDRQDAVACDARPG